MSLQEYETDRLESGGESLEITFLGHGSLLFTYGEKWIYVDPFTRVADYKTLPKADIIVITHEHRDHLDPEALAAIRMEETSVVCTARCAAQLEGAQVLENGDSTLVRGLPIEAVPAYNLVHKRESGEPFHPRGHGNGYVITFGDLRVLIAGDTENTPELKSLRDLDVAFLPMNLPYTMTPEMVAEAAVAMRPRILYPYHFGTTDPSELVNLLADEPDIEVRIRSLA